MKNLIILCMVLLSAGAVSAQTGRWIPDINSNSGRPDPYTRQKMALNGMYKLDSVVSERLDEVLDRWVPDNKEEYAYDSQGNQIFDTYYDWDPENEGWRANARQESGFDEDGHQILMIYYFWDHPTRDWTKYVKSEYVYENGLLIYDKTFFWDDSAEDWASEGIMTYTYVERALSYWIMSGSDLNYDGTIDNLDWIKSAYTYDRSGNLISEIMYHNSDPSIIWVAFSKTEYTYNTGNQMDSELSFFWDDETNKWRESSRDVYTYDHAGNLTSVIHSYWDVEKSDWFAYDETDYNFNADGDLVSMTMLSWDYSTGVMVGNFKNEYTFNPEFSAEDLILPYTFPPEFFNHMMTGYEQFDFADGNWVGTYRGRIFYSEVNASGISEISVSGLVVFPNPASGVVTFAGNHVSGTRVEIFDVHGRPLATEILPDNNRINVEQFTSGLYFYKLTGGGKTQHGKLVIK